MKHVVAIADRELRSLFLSPVAYVVLTLWSVLAGTFFLSSLIAFDQQLAQASQMGAAEYLARMNLNDDLLIPFFGSIVGMGTVNYAAVGTTYTLGKLVIDENL